MELTELEPRLLSDLHTIAGELGVKNFRKYSKQDLIMRVLAEQTPDRPMQLRTGLLDILPDGFGFLRTQGYTQSDSDIYVSLSQIRRFKLRRGDEIAGPVRTPKDNEKYHALLKIHTVNGLDPEQARHRPNFDSLTPLFPEERLRLETSSDRLAPRVMDIVCPIGKGQRGLIVSPPKAGKTTILKEIAHSITENNPECHLLVLLVDERPEEVTDMERSVNGEVGELHLRSAFREPPAGDGVGAGEVKRLVEVGKDVVVLLDSITRLARAYNLAAPASGRILSGGVDSTALYPPRSSSAPPATSRRAARSPSWARRWWTPARAWTRSSSRSSRAPATWRVHLSRQLANKRIFPAIDIEKSGTRKEELIMEPWRPRWCGKLRSVLHALDPNAAIELLIDKLRETRSNNEFLEQMRKNSR